MKKSIIHFLCLTALLLIGHLSFGQYSCTATIDQYNGFGGRDTFAAVGSFSPTASFSWSYGDGTGGYGQYVLHTYSTNGNYAACLTVSDSSIGCTYTICDSVHITNGTLSPCSTQISYTNIDSLYTLSSSNTGVGPYAYIWSVGSTNYTSSNPVITVLTTTTIYLTVTDSTGCIASANTTIYPVSGNCTASISQDPSNAGMGTDSFFCHRQL